jgi:hypothetical protein
MSMRLAILLACLLALISCTPETETTNRSPASSSAGSSSTTGLPARWSSSKLSSPLSVKVSSAFDTDFTAGDYDSDGYGPIRQMMKLWNESTTLYDFFNLSEANVGNREYSNLTDYYYQDGAQFGIYKSNSWFSDVSSAALAVTQYYGNKRTSSTGSQYVEIIHADIILNYASYTFTTDRFDFGSYDLPTVMLHELGHLLGLGHYSHPYAVMAPTLASYEVKRDLFYDKTNIANLYGSNNLAVKSLLKTNGAITPTSHPDDGEIVRGVIELMPSGDCHHYLEGKLIESHKAKLR